MEHRITKYPLEQGALEIEYIEEFFGEYKRRKTSSEIVGRLQNRDHLILMAMAPLPDDPGTVVPVSYKVAHEIRAEENIPKLADLVHRLRDYVNFNDRRILYTWVGGTRRDWRGQGHFRVERVASSSVLDDHFVAGPDLVQGWMALGKERMEEPP